MITFDDVLLVEAQRLGAATLHEAGGKIGALPARLRPLSLQTKVVGRAFPVTTPPGDNLWLHEAIVRAQPGDVVVDPGDLVLGDADGVVVVPKRRAIEVVALGRARADEEAGHFERLRAGETTFDIHGFHHPGQ